MRSRVSCSSSSCSRAIRARPGRDTPSCSPECRCISCGDVRRKASGVRRSTRSRRQDQTPLKEGRLTPHASRLTSYDLADGAALFEYPGLSDEEANARAVAGARALERHSPEGLLSAVVGARTLFLEFHPASCSSQRLADLVSTRESSRA